MVLVHLPAWSSSTRLRLPVLMVVLEEVDFFFFSSLAERAITAVPVTALP